MIATLNRVVEFVDDHLTEDLEIDGLAQSLGTTEYHVRRMFSSLAGMPLSEYIRRSKKLWYSKWSSATSNVPSFSTRTRSRRIGVNSFSALAYDARAMTFHSSPSGLRPFSMG